MVLTLSVPAPAFAYSPLVPFKLTILTNIRPCVGLLVDRHNSSAGAYPSEFCGFGSGIWVGIALGYES